MLYCILEYSEYSGETVAYGPYASHDGEAAWSAAMKRARRIAERRPGETKIKPDRQGNILVYDADYEETEPTDDDRHVLLTLQVLSKYSD